MIMDIASLKRKRSVELTPEKMEANRRELRKRQYFTNGAYLPKTPPKISHPPWSSPDDKITAMIAKGRATVAAYEVKKEAALNNKPNFTPTPTKAPVDESLAATPIDGLRHGRNSQSLTSTPTHAAPLDWSHLYQNSPSRPGQSDGNAAPLEVQLLDFWVQKLEKAVAELKREGLAANAFAQEQRNAFEGARRSLLSSAVDKANLEVANHGLRSQVEPLVMERKVEKAKLSVKKHEAAAKDADEMLKASGASREDLEVENEALRTEVESLRAAALNGAMYLG